MACPLVQVLYNQRMKTIPSAEFRKTYASLSEPTTITANGKSIGVFYPVGSEPHPAPVVDVQGILREVPFCPDCATRLRQYARSQGR